MGCPTNLATILFKNVQVGIVVIDADNKIIVDINPAACIMFGVMNDEIIGTPCSDWFCPKTELCPMLDDDGIPTNAIENEELLITRKDGSSVYVLRTAAVFYWDKRKHIIETLVDITHQKEVKKKYSDLVKYAPAGIYELDLKTGKFIVVNDVMVSYLGYSREEFLNMSAFDILTGEGQSKFIDRLNRFSQKQAVSPEVEYEVVSKDGHHFWVLLTARYLYDEKGIPYRAFCIVTDITERRKARMEAEKARDKAQLYLDMAFNIFVALDLNGNITLINKTGCDVLGIEECFLLGRNWFDNFIEDDERDELKAYFQQLIEEKFIEDVTEMENYVVASDKTKRLVRWKNKLIYSGGVIEGVFSSGEDVTAQRRYEEELVKALAKANDGLAAKLNTISNSIDPHAIISSRQSKRNELQKVIDKMVRG